MQDETGRRLATNYRSWQSDVVVDLIKRYGFPHITLNPGASFRGLHDSLVNYGGNEPPMMLCPHEEIAVQIAHGYAKATGRPMAVILHDLVGLLHACMAIYYAYIDRVPIFIIGATGPMDESKRRPHIDWTHSALVQGNAVRETDLVVCVDVKEWEEQLAELNSARRTRELLTAPSCDFVEIGFGEINIIEWAFDYCRMQSCRLRALGDTALGIPALTRASRQ